MTVAELIEKLSKLDPTSKLVVPGYQGGYREREIDIYEVELLKNVNPGWYYGEHDLADEYHEEVYPNAEREKFVGIW